MTTTNDNNSSNNNNNRNSDRERTVSLLDRHRLGQVAWTVDVAAAQDGDMI